MIDRATPFKQVSAAGADSASNHLAQTLPLSSQPPELTWRLASNQPGQAKSLRFQLLRGILPAVLIPLAIASTVGYRVIHESLEADLSQQVRSKAILASELTRDSLDALAEIPQLVADNPLVVEAAESAGERSPELSDLSLAEAEQRFAETKLLRVNADLNSYLSQTAATAGLAELFFTEQRGLNVAYSSPTSDFVQSDEAWWQGAQSNTSWISEPIFDESAQTFGIEFSQAIADPETGDFLGVVKAVVAADSATLQALPEILRRSGFEGSQQVQLLDAASGKILQTVTAAGLTTSSEITGGTLVGEVAAALNSTLSEGMDIASLEAELQAQYNLGELAITQLDETANQGILVTFTSQERKYFLSGIEDTSMMAIASIANDELEAAGQNLVLVFILVTLVAAGVATAVILRLANQLSGPLRYLSSTAEAVAKGNLEATAVPCGARETQTLANTFNTLVGRIKGFLQEQTSAAEQARLLSEIAAFRIRDQQDLTPAFSKALTEARSSLACDRVVVYRFNPDWSGYISHESVAPGWPQALNDQIEDPCIPQPLIEGYQKDRVVANDDVFNAGFHPDHLKLMERLQIKANLVVPILNEGNLFGLLIAHHCAESHKWQSLEITFMRQLALQLGSMLDQVVYLQGRLAETERSQALRDITLKTLEAETAEDVLAQLPVGQVRQTLQADRVLVYRFDQTWKGTITLESVAEPWPPALGAQIYDPCFEQNYVAKYKQGRVQATANIHEAGLTECHLKQLEPFKVKANLVAPINQGDQLLGLLIAHQCSRSRQWTKTEIDFFTQVATQVGLALDRCELLNQRALAAQQARSLATEQQQQKEALQTQLINLLSDVEGAASGDLTVRADVTTGEIGTVADFFNSIVENLRQIVTQVKTTAQQVNQSVGENEEAIRQLADEALSQTEDIARALSSVEVMTQSIQSVAESARQAAQVAHTASVTAESGGTAMERTEQNILVLRETIGTTAKKVKRLGESSQQISRVVSLINQIALQTNLLAINAGIEAARAGEEGQGFAVVAEEVGELANRSAAATQEIEKIVDAIQRETAQVVEAMEQSTTQVVEGTQLVEEAKASLDQIVDVSRQIDQLVQSISTATVSQVETSTSVSQLMQMIAEVSKHTSGSSLQVSNALRSTVTVAEALQASVGTFKVHAEG